MSSADSLAASRAVTYGCAGHRLTAEERQFFRDADPFGFILFGRNVASPDQVRALVSELRDAVGRDAPVLIDQEGGRVARLRPPHWPAHTPARTIGGVAEADRSRGLRAAWLHGRLIGAMLADLGIDLDCAPVADIPVPGSHDVIGDRAFCGDAHLAADLARAMADGLAAAGVMPCVKHIPGHGRALADSHLELPVVKASRTELEVTDFLPFRLLSGLPTGMAAHIVFTSIDADRPSSTSATVVNEVIRGWIGFDGLLFSDDLSMQALRGGPAERALAVLAGGCDIALHCNGKLAEMVEIAAAAPHMTEAAVLRWRRAKAWMPAVQAADTAALRAEFDQLLAAGDV
ncbi:beta-N-acetylhexosaminidase [Indioceanicola profundi]|uniref:beta-N-acetylhexosaminidase n=1 Tax=Indioceanicola profundi TaxID=2220096 RepID=UPI001968BA40|nr:beta-N-acetylhexosaminidase [Indioceanicola profundi]